MSKTACNIFLPLPSDEDTPSLPPERIELPTIPGGDTPLQLSDGEGSAGITGYSSGQGGLATNKDYNPTYRPALARGSYRNHGIYHQAYLENSTYRRAVRNIAEGLTTGFWAVEPFDDSEESRDIATRVESILFDLDGGWLRHVEEALYCLVSGFAIFVKIVDGFGQIRGLDFRYSHTINAWITDENQSDLLAVRFTDPSGSTAGYVKGASEILLYQFESLGNDFEGISPMRSVYSFVQAHQLFSQLEAVAAEKFGGPIVSIERDANATTDALDDATLQDILDKMKAADNPVILLPSGYRINISSPAGQMPNFDVVRRYCDEQISRILQAEGALLGSTSVGSYALAEVKDDVQLRSLFYYASLICRVVNGEGSRPYTGIVRHITDVLTGDSLTYRGRYPKLRWSLSPAQDEGIQIDQIASAHQAGLIELDEDDKALIRAKLGFPPKKAQPL